MQKLVEDVILGKKGAATLFYKEYSPYVRRYLHGKLSDLGAVEELLQDTFLSAFDALPLYRGDSSVKTWLLSIARHEMLDYYRKRYVRKMVEQTGVLFEGVAESLATPEMEWKRVEMSLLFDKAMSKLSKKYQKALELRYQKGLSIKEIAVVMKMQFKATESLIFRARGAFVEAYGA